MSSSQASESQAVTNEEMIHTRPTMSITERFRVIDDRLGHMQAGMTQFGDDLEEMEAGIFGMST